MKHEDTSSEYFSRVFYLSRSLAAPLSMYSIPYLFAFISIPIGSLILLSLAAALVP
jgi:hypothetical protein